MPLARLTGVNGQVSTVVGNRCRLWRGVKQRCNHRFVAKLNRYLASSGAGEISGRSSLWSGKQQPLNSCSLPCRCSKVQRSL